MGKSLTQIGLGASAGDGTGDPARTAFTKTNSGLSALATALFTDVSGEIAGVTAKTTPVDADVALIEDSAATNAKKKLTMANLATYVIGKVKATVNAFTKQQYFGEVALTWATSVAWNLDNAQTAYLDMEGDATLANPSNMHAGATYILRVEQDSTGSRVLSFGTAYHFPGGEEPVLTTAGGSVDLLTFYCDGSNMLGVPTLDLKAPP